MEKEHHRLKVWRRSVLFLVLSTSIILFGATMTLFWQQQYRQRTQANGAYVVSSPTLPAETVNEILAGTPMAGTGWAIEQAARNTNVDDAFALGVWWAETNDGAAGVGLSYRNPGGVRGNAGYAVGGGGYTIYPSYSSAIDDWFTLILNRYVDRGLTTVYSISYPYVGTSGAPTWANKVVNLMARYHAMAPAPIDLPTPTPTPAPTPVPTQIPTPKPLDWQQAPPAIGIHHSHVKQKVSTPASIREQSAISEGFAVSALLSTNQDLSIGFGLLSAVLLAAWGFAVRKQSTSIADSPTTPTLPITMNTHFDYQDKQRDTEALVPIGRTTEAISLLRRPTMSLPTRREDAALEPIGIKNMARPQPGGLLSRYRENSSKNWG